MNKNLLFKAPLFLAAVFFLLLSTSCNKDNDVTPAIEWQVEYVVTSIGDVTIEEIRYVDENGVEQTIPGQREFRLRFNAESGFIGKLEVDATASGGGSVARIDAVALDGTFDNLIVSDDDGHTGETPKSFTLSVVIVLP